MSTQPAPHPAATASRVLGVFTRGYHAWCKQPLSRRTRQDRELRERIEAIHARSRGHTGRRGPPRSTKQPAVNSVGGGTATTKLLPLGRDRFNRVTSCGRKYGPARTTDAVTFARPRQEALPDEGMLAWRAVGPPERTPSRVNWGFEPNSWVSLMPSCPGASRRLSRISALRAPPRGAIPICGQRLDRGGPSYRCLLDPFEASIWQRRGSPSNLLGEPCHVENGRTGPTV